MATNNKPVSAPAVAAIAAKSSRYVPNTTAPQYLPDSGAGLSEVHARLRHRPPTRQDRQADREANGSPRAHSFRASGVKHQPEPKRAVSTGVRKKFGELLGWFHESERLARPVVEAGRYAG
jgi:hypothetical protein